MKNRVLNLLVFVIVFTTNALAQHPDLQKGRWYVQQITTGGETIGIPDNPVSFPFTYLSFFSGSDFVTSENTPNINFYGIDCQIGFVGHVNFSSTDAFDFSDFTPTSLVSECNTPLSEFMSSYLNFFQENYTETFTYSIETNTDASKTLKIVNAVGDEIVYTNTFLVQPSAELTDNTWFLQNIVTDGTNNFPPDSEGLLVVKCDFLLKNDCPEVFNTIVCSPMSATQHFDIEESKFYLYETGVGLIQCGITEYDEYQNLYFDFFLKSLPGPYSYTLESSDNAKILTISNPKGDYIVFNSIISSVESIENSYFKVYPNPAKDKITVEVNKKTIKSISLYDVTGRKIIASDKNILDVSDLDKGLYFIHINTTDNQYFVKKVVID